MHTGKPGHLAAFDYKGCHRLFVTFCTDQRRPLFTNANVVATVLEQTRRAAEDTGVELVAYCFMPDHLHLLAEGEREDSDGRRFMALAKQLSGFHYCQRHGGRLWQRYVFERVLRSDEQMLAVARYILENPVRGGLVQNPEEYRFSGSMRYSVREILEASGEWRSG